MPEQLERPVEEIKRLQRCINDLVSVLALPAMWSGGDASQVARTLLDALPRKLNLDLVYVRLKYEADDTPAEMVKMIDSHDACPQPPEICAAIRQLLNDDPDQWAPRSRITLGDKVLCLVPLRLGLQGEMGVIAAGSQRADFPQQTEQLLLNVATNQASIGLQEARLRSLHKKLAGDLDQRVVQRTAELGLANQELRREIFDRTLVDEKLRREEMELKRSEARKTAILDSALDCIMTIDHVGRITEFNPAAERTFGFPREDVIGRPLADVIIPPAFREQHRRGFARYLATGEARVLGKRMEMTAMRADGTEFPVELAITRIPVDGPPSFTGYLRDITERRRSEEKLRRSEAYLAEAQRLSLTGSFGWSVSTNEHYWSDETFRIFEYDASTQITLALILQRVHPQDVPLMEQAIATAADGRNLDYGCRLLFPGGAVKYVHIVGHGTWDKDGRLEYIGAVQDVTDRHLSEEALGKVRWELARMARITSLGALTASIAHEVNQPLSGIITNASTCLRMLAADPPNVDGARETARRTIRDGHRASDVITRLRALFSRKESLAESVDLNEATREVIALTLSELQRNHVILETSLADDLPPVTGDRVQLQQVILNLLLNASEAMNAVDHRPRNLLVRTERAEADRISLSVKDAGVGLEPQTIDKLFEAFYTTKSGGMGIGLSVSRSIIESHHGRLWAMPNEGPGATFLFSIPRGTVGATSMPMAPDAEQVMRRL